MMENQDYGEGDEIRYSVVYVTAASLEQGQTIGRALVEEGLAACASIVDGIRSIFRWKGKIQEERECLLIIKCRLLRVPDIIDRVKELHSYDVPEIIALPIVDGNPSYLSWIEETG